MPEKSFSSNQKSYYLLKSDSILSTTRFSFEKNNTSSWRSFAAPAFTSLEIKAIKEFSKSLKLFRSDSSVDCTNLTAKSSSCIDFVDRFKSLCQDYYRLSSQEGFLENEIFWKSETETWDLIKILFSNRFSAPKHSISLPSSEVSETFWFKHLNLVNARFRETVLVKEWLEMHYSENINWASQLARTHQELDYYPLTRANLTSNTLDLDGPNRKVCPLNAVDKVKEQRMIQTVIQLLRGGKLDEAQQYVVNLGHAWLAAILEGLRYYYDPLCDGKNSTHTCIHGNLNRREWRLCCRSYAELCESGQERTLFAILGGDTQEALRNCTSFADALWVCVSAAVEDVIEAAPKNDHLSLLSASDMYVMPLEEMFSNISKSRNSKVLENMREVFPLIQTKVMLHDEKTLVLFLADRLEEHMAQIHDLSHGGSRVLSESVFQERSRFSTPSFFVLRFAAHFVVLLRQMEAFSFETADSHEENEPYQKKASLILEKYMEFLIESGEPDFHDVIASYAYYVSEEVRTVLFAQYLESLVNKGSKEIKDALQAASDHHIIIDAILVKFIDDCLDLLQKPLSATNANNQRLHVLMETIQFLGRSHHQLQAHYIFKTNKFLRILLATCNFGPDIWGLVHDTIGKLGVAYTTNNIPLGADDSAGANPDYDLAKYEFWFYSALDEAYEAYYAWQSDSLKVDLLQAARGRMIHVLSINWLHRPIEEGNLPVESVIEIQRFWKALRRKYIPRLFSDLCEMWKYSNAGEDEIRKVIGILAQKQSDDLYEDGADIARILLEKINNVAFLFLPKANQ